MIGIFLEPDASLKRFILIEKKKLSKKISRSRFVKHPPHCTIIYTEINNYNEAIKVLSQNFKTKKIKIKCKNFSYLESGDSINNKILYIKINKNKLLTNLQAQVAKELKPLINKKFIKKNIKLYKNSSLKRSFKNYGFPYVGKHWKPHFTIGSVGRKENILDFYKKRKFIFVLNIKYISIWRINKNKHKLLKKIKIN